MSSILKALEKVEESQNARRSGGASGFVKSRERRPPWVLPVGILSGAAVAALATFAAMGGFSRHAAHAPAPAATVETLRTETVKEPVIVADPGPNLKQATVPAGPVAAKQVATAQPVPKVAKTAAKQAPVRVQAVAAKNAVPAAPRPAVQHQAVVPPPPVQAAAVPVAPAAPAPEKRQRIAVTGIAWQNDSASSVAMVNGKTVRQGATVDGYKVEQIFEDKVRFSGSNGKIEVPLSAGD